ncbi:Ycs4p [Sugiyamaella lignohabitans]|uniref:Ycs4p n=1 Tax=Sugiyamaella lignohabitans TaxID=796027 RepID=A0A167DNX7_9ASCO|nr:Ycs4p [Sugiyamaella lignohabitans]ANB13119.1 Ycs4p [Sugiyamaella lignohabitans]
MFLLQWYLVNLDQSLTKLKVSSASTASGKVASNKNNKEFQTGVSSILASYDVICKCLRAFSEDLFVTTSERDLFAGLYLRPAYLFLENEQLVKDEGVRMHLFKCICIAVKSHHQQLGVLTSLLQLLIYYEHLSEPLAELLQILYEQYDHSGLGDEILHELSTKTFNNNDAKSPKVISVFLIKLSKLAPLLVMKNMTVIVKLLDSESFTLRCAIIEVAGNIVIHFCRQDGDQSEETGANIEQHKTQVHVLLDLVEERSMDINPYCRSKALQVLSAICELETKFVKRRPVMTKIAVQALKDRATLVRRQGIKLINRLISTHPFNQLHGSQLNLKEWKGRLAGVNQELDKIVPSDAGDMSMLDPDALDSPSDDDSEGAPEKQTTPTADVELINKLQLTAKYYSEAIEFINLIHEALDRCETLLLSKHKTEVIDSMDLFVLADAYGIQHASTGIRKMIHLIWAKANNDEGQQIQSHLVDCYQRLFFETPAEMPEREANILVARNLMSLTYGATLAELASLEKLLMLAMEKDQLISPGVIRTLWKVYSFQQREISKSQRRGAIIIIGMIAKADHSVATAGMEMLLKIGLGEQGRADLGLAKYTCVALQQCVSEDEWKKANTGSPARLQVTHEAIAALANVLIDHCDDWEWFGVAEQAIKAINDLCESPDIVFSEIIRTKTKKIFGAEESTRTPKQKEASLSQLLFIIGDVALKTLVHLERCEILFKRSKIASEKASASQRESKSKDDGNKSASAEQEDDLNAAAGGGTSEDDFSEAIAYIRERELLFGEKSLLTRFGVMVSNICRQGLSKNLDEKLNVSATLCLAKFMCVSATYCEQNLQILMALMDKSDNSTIRSNCVLALGDIAVCFNYMLDENTDFLYRRLHDRFSVVQRTCLMTLTFLILAGQVKVKGQLGEMAKCLEDPDKRISDLARMFFTELSTKDNAIYNGFIDMFSMLSADGDLSQESLHKILKFLSSFIDKEKQVKQLSNKLLDRLVRSESQKAWNDISYVLGILPHKSEEIDAKIQEGFKYTAVIVE